jgi:hypothetical protein
MFTTIKNPKCWMLGSKKEDWLDNFLFFLSIWLSYHYTFKGEKQIWNNEKHEAMLRAIGN